MFNIKLIIYQSRKSFKLRLISCVINIGGSQRSCAGCTGSLIISECIESGVDKTCDYRRSVARRSVITETD